MTESFKQSVLRQYDEFIRKNEEWLSQIKNGALPSSNPSARIAELTLQLDQLRTLRALYDETLTED